MRMRDCKSVIITRINLIIYQIQGTSISYIFQIIGNFYMHKHNYNLRMRKKNGGQGGRCEIIPMVPNMDMDHGSDNILPGLFITYQ